MSLTQIEVPVGYAPRVRIHQRTDNQRWVWRYDLPDGQTFSVTTNLDERRAKSEAKRKERDLTRGLFNQDEIEKMQRMKAGSISSPIQLADEYLRVTSVEKTGATKNGEEALIRAMFRVLQNDLGVTLLAGLRPKHLHSLRDLIVAKIARGELRPISGRNQLKAVLKVLRWARKRSILIIDPTSGLDPIEVRESERARTVTLTDDQIQVIVQAHCDLKSGFDVKKFFLLLYATGMRPGELLNLEWTDVDLMRGMIILREKATCPTRFGIGWKPKWGKARVVPLNDTARFILSGMQKLPSVGYVRGRNDPLPAQFVFVTKDRKRSTSEMPAWKRVDDARYAWGKLLRTAGIWSPDTESLLARTAPPFHRHDVRRTWSAHAKASGESIETASQIMGNNPVTNVQHYRDTADEQRLQKSAKRHPSNRIAVCIAGVSDSKFDSDASITENERDKTTA